MSDPGARSGPSSVVKIEPDADLLEIITRGSAHGITIQDASGHLIYANDAAARMCDFGSGDEMRRAPAEAIVERFEILDEDGLPLPPEDLPGRRAARGERDPEAIVRFPHGPAATIDGLSFAPDRSSTTTEGCSTW